MMWYSEELKPTSKAIISAAATFTASVILIRSIADDLIPDALRTRLHKLSTWLSSDLTIVVDEFDALTPNKLFKATNVYLGNAISSLSAHRMKVNISEKEKNFSVTIDKDQELVDSFDGAKFTWILATSKIENPASSQVATISEARRYELSFHKKFKQKALEIYLPYVLEKAKEIEDRRKPVRLHTVDYGGPDYWSGVNLDHPASFETVAMDSGAKKALLEDLERFTSRKEYYRRVGKAWKRGYLLYGPPGTGKSSLVAAVANHLRFDVYDLDLKEVQCNSDLRRLLIGMKNRSILVIEDIDCSIDLRRNRNETESSDYDEKITLSGLLNFVDGLWSSCGDERIVIFTTNNKEKLDPALLRPGRMDLHVHMSYCDFEGFRTLAWNYLRVKESPVFYEIKGLLGKVRATPAEIGGELMKSDDPEVSLEGLVYFLQSRENSDSV